MSLVEVSFAWEGRSVNLKLARSIVRFLAEHHGRLAEVGPTRCLRDILDWFRHCDPNDDESFRALENKHGDSADFDNVCEFLKAYDYDELKRRFPKQCGSLWMAVRGVLRRMNRRAEQVESSTMSSKGSDDYGGRTQGSPNPSASIQTIREGSDEIAFELLMLLSHPSTLHLGRESREQLEHAEQTLMTAVDDLRLILRHFPSPEDDDVVMKVEDGGGSGASDGSSGSPDSGFPTSPSGSSSSSSGDSGFRAPDGPRGSNGSAPPGGHSWNFDSMTKKIQEVLNAGSSGQPTRRASTRNRTAPVPETTAGAVGAPTTVEGAAAESAPGSATACPEDSKLKRASKRISKSVSITETFKRLSSRRGGAFEIHQAAAAAQETAASAGGAT